MSEERKSRYELFLEEEERKAQPTKRCPKCKEVKFLSEYYKNRSRCKSCESKRKYKDSVDRFWKYYHSHYENVGDCLEWTGAKHSDGQPVCQWEGRQTRVRRVVYKLAIGELADSEYVLTKCKNRLCVRQSHFIKGTREDRDIFAWNNAAIGDRNGARTHPEKINWKFRQPEYRSRGAAHGNSKLTEEDVCAIRAIYAAGGITQREIAVQFGIHQINVSQIVTRKTWKHVNAHEP